MPVEFGQKDLIFGEKDKVEVQIAPKVSVKEKEPVQVKTITPDVRTETTEPQPHLGAKLPSSGEPLQFEAEFERKLSFVDAWQQYLFPKKYEERWTKPDRAEKFHNAVIWPIEGSLQAFDSVLNRANKFVTAVSPIPELMLTAATLDPSALYGILPSILEARMVFIPKPGTADELKTLGESLSEDWYEPLTGEKPPDWYVPAMDIAFETLLLSGMAAKKASMATRAEYSTSKLTSVEIKAAQKIFSKSKLAKMSPAAVRMELAKTSVMERLTQAQEIQLLRRGYTKNHIQQMTQQEMYATLTSDAPKSYFSEGSKRAMSKLTELVKGAKKQKYEIEGKPLNKKQYKKIVQEMADEQLDLARLKVPKGKAGREPEHIQTLIETTSGKIMREDFRFPDIALPEMSPADEYYLLNELRVSGLSQERFHKTGAALFKVLDGEIPSGNQIDLLQSFYGDDIARALLKHRTVGTKTWAGVLDAINIPRATLASMDLSFPLRQGAMLLPGHPIQWSKSFGQMMKAARPGKKGKDYARYLERMAENSRYSGLRRKSGLEITQWGLTDLTAREEGFMSSFADKIPGVKWSNRTYTVMSNQLRLNVFDSTARSWERAGMNWIDNPKAYERLASFLNHATGRGTIPEWLKGQEVLLSAAFFSPKFQLSKWQVPVDLAKSLGNAPIRKLIVKDLVAYVGAGMAGMYLLSNVEGVEVDWSPDSFGRVTIGDTRYDYWSGNAQIARTISRLSGGKGILGGEVLDVDRAKVLRRFLRSKLSPAGGLVVDLLTGETFMGEKMSTKQEFLLEASLDFPFFTGNIPERFLPLVWQDIGDAIRFQGYDGLLPVTSVTAFFGVGANTWEVSKWELLSRERDSVAMETYGKQWDGLNEIEQQLLLADNELIANLEREAAYEGTVFPFLEEMKQAEVNAGFDVELSLPEPVQTEMQRLKIRVGMLPRTWGTWTLNNKRYERYKSILALELAERLPEIIESDDWTETDGFTQTLLIEGAIENAKSLASTTLRIEVMNEQEREGVPRTQRDKMLLEKIDFEPAVQDIKDAIKGIFLPSRVPDPATIAAETTVTPTVEPAEVPAEVPEEYRRLGVTRYTPPAEVPTFGEDDVVFGMDDEVVSPDTVPIAAPDTPVEAQVEPEGMIDTDKIIQIESSGRADAVSSAGATGLMQLMKETWDETTEKMGVDWNYSEAKDPVKNKAVGTYYMNIEIPRLLSSFGIPDNLENRLGAYNWGIGNLKTAYESEGENWLDIAPEETQRYIEKYKAL